MSADNARSSQESVASIDWALPAPGRVTRLLIAGFSLVLIAVIGVLDVISGTDLTLSPLYLIAIIIGTWRGGPWVGFSATIASVLTGSVADLLLSEPYLHLENSYTSAWIPFGNIIARVLVFVGATLAVSKLQSLLCERDRAVRGALGQIRSLESLLPVCAWCKRIRDERDADRWKTIEQYIAEHTDTKFTHGMCPDCFARVWQEEGL